MQNDSDREAKVNEPALEDVPDQGNRAELGKGSPLEVFLVFLRLGLTSFGGPVAHLGYFQREIIDRRKWITQTAYGDLIALCQFLPGPASSQVALSLGYLRAGIRGAFAANVGFTSPSAILMIAIAYGFQFLGRAVQSGLDHGRGFSGRTQRGASRFLFAASLETTPLANSAPVRCRRRPNPAPIDERMKGLSA